MPHSGVDLDRERMKAWLAWKGWTARDLAREMGCERTYVWRVLEGKARPGAKFMAGLYRVGLDPRDVCVLPGVFTEIAHKKTRARRERRKVM
jgi:transcriptional regulator with XRE-family HTH domain